METMNQIRHEHRRAVEKGSKQSLKAFAKEAGVIAIVKTAHKSASKPRQDSTRGRTSMAMQARRDARAKARAK